MTFLSGFLAGLTLSSVLLLIVPKLRHVAPTKRDLPERNLFNELKEGVEELERMREGVDYKWLGMTGSEQE